MGAGGRGGGRRGRHRLAGGRDLDRLPGGQIGVARDPVVGGEAVEREPVGRGDPRQRLARADDMGDGGPRRRG